MSIKVMAEVWSLALSHSEQSVLLVMADHADDDGARCYPSVALIAWKTGYKERQVQRAMKSLRDAGIMTPVSHTKGGSTRDGRGYATEYVIDLGKGVKKTPFVNRFTVRVTVDVKATPPSEVRRVSSTTGRVSSKTTKDVPQDTPTVKEPSKETSEKEPPEEWILILRDVPGWDEKGRKYEGQLIAWAKRKNLSQEVLEASAIGLAKAKTKTLKGYDNLARAFQDRINKGYDSDAPPSSGSSTSSEGEDPEPVKAGPVDRGDDGLWVKVLKDMESQVPRPAFETWFKGSVGMGFANGVLVVGTTSAAAKVLNDRYYYAITKSIADHLGDRPVQIAFVEN